MIHFKQVLVVTIIYLASLAAKADCNYVSDNFHEKALLACTYESDALNLESRFPVFWNRIRNEAIDYCSTAGKPAPRFYSETSYVPYEMLPGESNPYPYTAYGETTYYLYFACAGTDYIDGNMWIVPGPDDDYSVTSIEIIQNDSTAIDSDHDGVVEILPFARSTIRINFNHAHPAVMEQTDPYIKVYIDGAEAPPGSPQYARFTDNFRAEGAHSAVFSFTSPTTPGTHEIKVVIDEDQFISEADYSNNTMTLQFSTEPPKPSNSLSIDRMRMAQTVFDPVVDPGQPTLALVSDKDFAVDVTLSGSLSSEFSDSTATAQVLVDGVAAGPVVEFKPSGINNGANRLFAYGRYNTEGVHQVAVQIRFKNHPIPDVLDGTHYLEESTTRTFFRTSMKVLTGQVLGCTTGTSCFSSPNSQDISNFNVSQLTLANQLLPISGNGLTLEKGADIQGSQPGFFALAKDFLKIWKLKHDANATAAAYLVSESYMTKMGQDHAGTETAGLTINPLHVSLISARGYNVLAHELIHSLRSVEHSPLKETEGFNVGTKTVYGENFKSLTDNVIITPLKAANVFYYEVQEERKLDQLIDPYTYSNTFRDIMIPSIDPKAILVSGAVDNSGQVAFIDATRSETI